MLTGVVGQVGPGVNFTGGDQYHSYYAATSGVSGLGTGNTTVEGWVYLNSLWPSDGGATSLFGSQPGAYPYKGNDLEVTTAGKLQVLIDEQNETVALSPTAMTTGAWHHVAFTYDHVNATIYLDGQFLASGAPAYPALIDGVFQLNCGWGGCTDAQFDEIRVSNTNRSASWIATEYANQSALGRGSFYTVGPLE